jgi:hypothetical protein
MDIKIDLIRKCERIVKEIESGEYDMDELAVEEWGGPCAGHYLSNVPDIEYTVSRRGEYLGALVLAACGGPNIYIDTREKEVRGRWGDNSVELPYINDALNLDDCLEEGFDCLRG